MKKLFIAAMVSALLALLQLPVGAAPLAISPEAAFSKSFPQVKADSITKSNVKGVYEVVSGQNVFYFYFFPEKEMFLVGDMVTTTGQSAGAEKKRELKAKLQEQVQAKLKDIPLQKAVKVGSGPKTVIEFTDPDCPYCRRASEALKSRTDITRYVFLTPIAHPNAITKVHYILSATEQEKAYHEMMEGKPVPASSTEYSKGVREQAEEHMKLARSLAIDGTPTFFINGQQVVGADMARINELLK